jgi:hypothetical protein
MRIIRNERHIRTRSFIGRYATMGGLLALFAGLIISFVRPTWLTPMMICVAVGVGCSMVGGFFAERYLGPLAHHEALAQALKGLDDQHTLVEYQLPAPHVLLSPGGCTVVVVKAHGGQVSYVDGRWRHRQRGKFFRQFAGQEALGGPDYEAERQGQKMEAWLADHLPESEVPVQAAIVFVNPDVTLDAADSPVPALFGKKLKSWLRGPGKLKTMPNELRRELEEAAGINAEQSQ